MENINGRQFEHILRNELGESRVGEAKRSRHPRSGYKIEVGRQTRIVEGSSPPEIKVIDHGHLAGRRGTPGESQGMMGHTEVGRKPLKYVYRGVSEEDYQGIQKRGTIQSDGRGNICADEGTCAGRDPRTAGVYLGEGQGRILKIRVHPDDEWRVDPADAYIKTNRPVPISRIVRATGTLTKQGGRYYR